MIETWNSYIIHFPHLYIGGKTPSAKIQNWFRYTEKISNFSDFSDEEALQDISVLLHRKYTFVIAISQNVCLLVFCNSLLFYFQRMDLEQNQEFCR